MTVRTSIPSPLSHRQRRPLALASTFWLLPLIGVAACGDDTPSLGDTPAITSFTASANEVESGQTVTLNWATTGADQISITAAPGGEVTTSMMASGSVMSAALTERTAFTLEASGNGMTVRDVVMVDISGPPPPPDPPTVTTLSVTPDPVDFNAQFTVTWAVENADTVRITLDGAEIENTMESSGTLMRAASRPEGQLLVLEATNGGGTTSRNLPINVTPPPGLEVEPNDSPASATRVDDMGIATARLESNDQDYFQIDVVEGGWVRAETSDGRGGCAVDQDMELRDSNGMVLANGIFGEFVLDGNGAAIGACRLIDPRIDDGARSLAAGTYFIRVVSGMFQPPVGDYTIQITTGGPGCGNGIIEAGEQCDDGNMTDGDGCSMMCTVPNPQIVTPADGQPTLLSGALPDNGVTLVQLEVSTPGTLVAEVGAPIVGDCTSSMRLVLLDAMFNEIGVISDIPQNNAVYPCGRFDPDRTATESTLAAGTYFLRAEALDGEAVAAHQLMVRLYPGSGCGNGYREQMELCDDGNTDDTDYCNSACNLNPLPVDSARATLNMDSRFGPFQRVRVAVGARTSLTATVTSAGTSTTGNCGVPTFMGLIQPQAAVSVIGLSAPGVPNCGGIDQPASSYAADLAPASYDMVVVTSGPSPGGPVTVSASGINPSCGNGIVEPSNREQCDDGNLVETDACRSDCIENSVRFTETEPNNQINQANQLSVTPGGALTIVSAAFASATDVDIFEVNLPANAQIDLQTYTTDGNRLDCQTVDTILLLVNDQSQIVAQNDDSNGLCSRLQTANTPALQNLAAGQYFVVVQPFQNSAPGSYFLDVKVE